MKKITMEGTAIINYKQKIKGTKKTEIVTKEFSSGREYDVTDQELKLIKQSVNTYKNKQMKTGN